MAAVVRTWHGETMDTDRRPATTSAGTVLRLVLAASVVLAATSITDARPVTAGLATDGGDTDAAAHDTHTQCAIEMDDDEPLPFATTLAGGPECPADTRPGQGDRGWDGFYADLRHRRMVFDHPPPAMRRALTDGHDSHPDAWLATPWRRPIGTRASRLWLDKHPVDAVITYINPWDEERERQREEVGAGRAQAPASTPWRYDEAYLTSRSVIRNMPWARSLVIAMPGNTDPVWLDEIRAIAHFPVRVVRDHEYVPAECLPSFNSNLIETYLDAIEGLSDVFVYLMDDTLLATPIEPDAIMDARGRVRVRAWDIYRGDEFAWNSTMEPSVYRSSLNNTINVLRSSDEALADAEFRERIGREGVIKGGHSMYVFRKDAGEEMRTRFASHVARMCTETGPLRQPTDLVVSIVQNNVAPEGRALVRREGWTDRRRSVHDTFVKNTLFSTDKKKLARDLYGNGARSRVRGTVNFQHVAQRPLIRMKKRDLHYMARLVLPSLEELQAFDEALAIAEEDLQGMVLTAWERPSDLTKR